MKYELISNLPPKSYYGAREYKADLESLTAESFGPAVAKLLEDRYLGNAAGWRCIPESLRVGDFDEPKYYSSPRQGEYRVAPVYIDAGGMDLAHEKVPAPSPTIIGYIWERLGDCPVVIRAE